MTDDPRGIPPAIALGAALSVAVSAVLSLLLVYALGGEGYRSRADASWFTDFIFYGRPLLLTGAAFATATLMLAGFHELIRRAGAGPEVLFLRLAMIGLAGILATLLAAIYLNYWYVPTLAERGPTLRETLDTFWTWHRRVLCGSALVASAGLLLAGRRLPLVQALALPLLIATLFAYPTTSVWELTHEARGSRADRWLETLVDIGIRLTFAGTLFAVADTVARSLPPSMADFGRAGGGLHRVGSALVARVLVAVIAAFTLVTTFGSQSMTLAKGAAVVFPCGLLIASLALVTGLLQAAALAAIGAPRFRLYAAAALTTIGVVIDALKGLALYVELTHRGGGGGYGSNVERSALSLPYVAPAVTLAGLLCLLSAARALRRWAPGARVDDGAISAAAVLVTFCSVAAVGMMQWARGGGIDSSGGFIVVSILVAIATVISQLSVARVCHRVAEELRDTPGLPTAVVASSS